MPDSNPISDPQALQSPTSDTRRWRAVSAKPTEPGLYIIATPIGNLRDITLRALDILADADLILAEDTRQSRKLLSAYDIKSASIIPYHDHNVAKQLPKVMEALKNGQIVAQISDAGTPLISDPGYKLVLSAVEAGYSVYPVPGASSPLAALMVAGLPTDRFLFVGFLPPKSNARQSVLQELSAISATLVFFETGPRILSTLSDIGDVLGERDIVIARELTKHYEEIIRGKPAELIHLISETPLKGEIVLLVGPPMADTKWSEEQIDTQIAAADMSLGMKQVSREIAAQSGWAARDVYARANALKSRGE